MNLNAGDDGVIGFARVHGLVDELVEIATSDAIGEPRDVGERQPASGNLIFIHGGDESTSENGKFWIGGIVSTLLEIHLQFTLLEFLEQRLNLDQRAARARLSATPRAQNAPDAPLGVDGHVRHGEQHVPFLPRQMIGGRVTQSSAQTGRPRADHPTQTVQIHRISKNVVDGVLQRKRNLVSTKTRQRDRIIRGETESSQHDLGSK